MAFKDNFRIEKIYFQRVKDDAQILGSWKNDPRRYSREEIIRVAKDACDSILMLYRLIGESWNDALNHIEKLGAELEALAGKTEAYHDELNEKIDEVNNYLNTQIKNLEIRVENIENSIEAFGGLPSNENANEGDVLTVGENHVNEWKAPKGIIFIDANWNNENGGEVNLTLNNEAITAKEIYELLNSGYYVKVKLNSFYSEGLPTDEDGLPIGAIILDLMQYKRANYEDSQVYHITWKTNYLQGLREDAFSTLDSISLDLEGYDEEDSDYAFVTFNNVRGFNFEIKSEDNSPIPNHDLSLMSGITFKNAFLMGIDYFSRNGTLTYSENDLKFILPLIAVGNEVVNTTDPEKPIYRLILRFYDVTGGTSQTNFEWVVYWDYNTLTDEERIYVWGAT